MKYFLLFLFFIPFVAVAQERYIPDPDINILHYSFDITLSDQSDKIECTKFVKVHFLGMKNEFALDLQSRDDSGRGMIVTTVKDGKGKALKFRHADNKLHIFLPKTVKKGDVRTFKIDYYGIPADGIVIGKNMYGDRTFFGDNYPDRARCWLPCVDFPSDKATLDWVVTAPSHYWVIGNGAFVEKKDLNDTVTLTHWREDVPISTKIMVIAAAGFAVDTAGMFGNVPVESWVYPQNREKGFRAFGIALPIVVFYDSLMGTYPYEKLANVQSTTRYGGCENASNIFYAERSVFGSPFSIETLVAHEIVHQWFGNSVTENDWSQAWLSEGFATYLTHVYVEDRYGRERMVEGLKRDRERVISYLHYKPLPVVDTLLVTYPVVEDIDELLSTNTYQKGGWFLHMLRCELGDDTFLKGIRRYYKRFRNSTASTADLQKVMENVSGKDLNVFFRQWLYQPQIPVLDGYRSFDAGKNKLTITLVQKQDYLFDVSFSVGIVLPDGEVISKKVRLNKRSQSFAFDVGIKPVKVLTDPDTELLYEGVSSLPER